MQNLSNIVEYLDNDFFTGTFALSQFFEVEHRSLKQTIRSNLKDIEDLGENKLKERKTFDILNVENKKKTKQGRPVIEYLLNEPQATFVILLLKGHYKKEGKTKVVYFKKRLTQMFFKQRKLLAKLLSQKQNAEWLEKRAQGKIERKVETDTIKKFVEYSKEQGSKNAQKYYMIISKMENQSLFHLDYVSQKIPNIREIAEGFQLDSLKMADRIVAKAIKEGMEEQMQYKDIFQMCKKRVQQFADVLGKTPLELSMQNPVKKLTWKF